MEGQIRKQRQETLYRQRERRQKFLEYVIITGTCAIAIVLFVTAYIVVKGN